MTKGAMVRLATGLLLGAMFSAAGAAERGCAASAQSLFLACGFDLREGYLNALAVCSDTSDQDKANACVIKAKHEMAENGEECDAVFEARRTVCSKLNNAAHEVPFGENFAPNFVDPLEIGVTVDPNPWFPLVQGNVWVYEASGVDDEGEAVEETIKVTVTSAVKLIEGIRCLVVNDIVTEDGDLIEDTEDWYAQDKDGNVWYCGEIAKNYEKFEGDDPDDAELVDLDGSWKSGRDEAKAGMLLPFAPAVGQIIRQEVLFTDAEDVIEIESLTGSESAPAASCSANCLVTLDYSPLEPGVFENKYYARGIGMIVETKHDSDERVELVEFTGQ